MAGQMMRTEARVGKAVGRSLYLHVSALGTADALIVEMVDRAASLARSPPFNVVRVEQMDGIVALLEYSNFFESAFPRLARSWKVNAAAGRVSFRDYSDSLNPPILHRKELLLPQGHPDVAKFARLTADLEGLGLFADPVRIGFEVQWNALLRERGYQVVEHEVVPIGNNEGGDALTNEVPIASTSGAVLRHLTALSRQNLSAPVAAMLRMGLLNGEATFFDYGCGKGDDVAALGAAGITASGWDPHYAPNEQLRRSDYVNIGFVINVIEDPSERREALTKAFELADVALCVSAMLAHEDSVQGRPYADGVLTKWNTFQKYFSQTELRAYIESTLGTQAVALAPGIFLAFKDVAAEQRFYLSRSRSQLRVRQASILIPKPSKPPRLPREPKIRPTREPRPPRLEPWELCPEAFHALCTRWEGLGRDPGPEELGPQPKLKAAFGSMQKALRAAWGRLDRARFDAARVQRAEDTLVYLALQRFRRRAPYRQLDLSLQRDVRAFFGDYASALSAADRLLVEAGSPNVITEAACRASERGLGWLVEGKALQLHASLVNRLPAVLRIYVGCAGILYGDIEMADLVKIHLASGKVTMIRCDNFELPIPRVIERVKINLRTQDVLMFSYGGETGCEPPLLYLKSRFMSEEMPQYVEQTEFDARLETVVEVDELSRGPSAKGLEATLRQAWLRIAGFSLVENDGPPSLDDLCGAHLTYRDLIVCGETALRTGISNLPNSLESYRALRALAENVLDPVIEWYGSVELTYGFCSPELAKLIPGRIAPELDQHAAHELKRSGHPVCPRLGAAVDFLVRDEDMVEVAKWVACNTPFDRLYIYGRDRPIHVSFGPEAKREVYEMVPAKGGRRVPKRLKIEKPEL